MTTTYTYGNALLRKDGETPMFDSLGSSRTVTNASGASSASLTLSAFGGTVTSSGTTASAYKFGATSGYRDDGDGLVKVGCRYYDPEVGRFTTRDTDLDEAPYVYCDGDPVNELDPSGHDGAPALPQPPPSLPPIKPIHLVIGGTDYGDGSPGTINTPVGSGKGGGGSNSNNGHVVTVGLTTGISETDDPKKGTTDSNTVGIKITGGPVSVTIGHNFNNGDNVYTATWTPTLFKFKW